METESTALSAPLTSLSALVSVLQEGNGHPRLAPVALLNRPTSLDLATVRGKARFMNALLSSEFTPDDVLDCELSITDYLLVGRDDGEPNEDGSTVYPSLYLIQSDGTSVRVTSSVVVDAFGILINDSMYGPGPWNPPLIMKLLQRKSKAKGRTFHSLHIVEPPSDF